MSNLSIEIAVGLAGLACSIIAIVAMHTRPAGVSAVRDPICFYATSANAPLFAASSLGMGIAALCLAFQLPRARAGISLPGSACLAGFALARLAIVLFPADRGARTARGRVHVLLDVLTFTGISAAAFLMTRGLAPLGWGLATAWAASGPAALVSAIATQAFAFTTLPVIAIPALRAWTGLNERCLFAAFLAWLSAAYASFLSP